MWLGIAGFIASALVHVLALAGVPSPFGQATWFLHIRIFVVWIPAILLGQRLTNTARRATAFKGSISRLSCVGSVGIVCPARVRDPVRNTVP